jgi:hypothetical protein
VEDWAEIRRLWKAERMPIKAIAWVLGCSKNTLKKALADEDPLLVAPCWTRSSGELPASALPTQLAAWSPAVGNTRLCLEVGGHRIRPGSLMVWSSSI